MGEIEKRKKKGTPEWEEPPNDKQKKRQTFELFFSNYPLRLSMEAIMGAFCQVVIDKYGHPPVFRDQASFLDGFRVSVPDAAQMNGIREMNGVLVFNQPIWIIKFPSQLGALYDPLARIFQQNVSNGIVDLTNLTLQFQTLGYDPKWINFKQRDFVEFLFFRLGTTSRDERFFVETLVLNQNPIESIDLWSPFFAFLPNLHYLIVNETFIRREPKLSNCPYLIVIWGQAISSLR
jgi:hypothetical protein